MVALDLDSGVWHVVDGTGGRGPTAAPGPRASGSAVVYQGDKIVLFGGYDGEDFLDVSGRARAHVAGEATRRRDVRALHARLLPRALLHVQDLWILHTVDPDTGGERARGRVCVCAE